MRKNNKGFSLVELIVVIAILAIIGSAIIGFMMTSFRSYRRVSAESSLANELQLTMNRLENLIMDCGNGISYQYNGTAGSGTASGFVFDDGEISSGVNVEEKVLMVYDQGYRYIITWKNADKKLYYTKEERKLDSSTGTYSFLSGEQIELADFIEGFQVTINDSKKETLVTVKLSVKKDGRTSSASQKFALRNSLAINETDETVIYGEKNTTVPDTYEGIVVKANGVTYTKDTTSTCDVLISEGNDITIPFTATIQGGGFPSQDVIWDVKGSTAGASCSHGVLLIPSSETASELYVTATSKVEPTCFVTVTVNIMKITGISILAGSGVYPDQFYDGSTIALNSATGLNARVDGSGNLSEDMKGFHWAAGANCNVSGNTLEIKGAVGDTFVVYAVSDQNSSIRKAFSGTIVKKSLTLVISTKDNVTTLNRGGSLKLTAKSADGSMTYNNSDVTWTCTLEGASSGVTMSGSTVKVDSTLDYASSYNVTVSAALSTELTDGEEVTSSIGLQIPVVSLLFSNSGDGAYANSVSLDMSSLSSGQSKSVYYQLVGVEDNGSLSFNWSQSGFDSSVNVSGNKITITKQNASYKAVTGTAKVNGIAVSDATITIAYQYNLWFTWPDGLYIPPEATDGWVTLDNNITYRVTYNTDDWTPYYKLELTRNGTASVYKIWSNNLTSDWYQVS